MRMVVDKRWVNDAWDPEFDDDESLDVFFESIGVRDFYSGWEGGAYGIDCGHVGAGRLSQEAWEQATKYSDQKRYWLRHTTESPTTYRGKLGGGMGIEIVDAGEVEDPWAVAPNRVKYTFRYVEWHDDAFAIFVETATEGTLMTLPQLRELFDVCVPDPSVSPPEPMRPTGIWARLRENWARWTSSSIDTQRDSV